MKDKPFSYEEFKSIYSKVPRLCVDLIVQTEEGILLTKRAMPPCEGQWHLPGGTVLFKESIPEAIDRVAQAEIGIGVEVVKNIGYIEFMKVNNLGGFDHPISLAFLCKPKTLDIKLDAQASEYAFFKAIPENTLKEQADFLQKTLVETVI